MYYTYCSATFYCQQYKNKVFHNNAFMAKLRRRKKKNKHAWVFM